jgi:hypothetical protein
MLSLLLAVEAVAQLMTVCLAVVVVADFKFSLESY